MNTKSTLSSGSVVLMLVCFAQFAIAQDAAQTVSPSLLPPAMPVSFATPPAPELSTSAGDNERKFHITGDVGVGYYWAHGGGFSSAPFLGTTGSVSIIGPHAGAGVSWNDFSTTTKVGEWNTSHRP